MIKTLVVSVVTILWIILTAIEHMEWIIAEWIKHQCWDQMLSVMERMLPAGILASVASPRMRKITRVLEGMVAVAISGLPSHPCAPRLYIETATCSQTDTHQHKPQEREETSVFTAWENLLLYNERGLTSRRTEHDFQKLIMWPWRSGVTTLTVTSVDSPDLHLLQSVTCTKRWICPSFKLNQMNEFKRKLADHHTMEQKHLSIKDAAGLKSRSQDCAVLRFAPSSRRPRLGFVCRNNGRLMRFTHNGW